MMLMRFDRIMKVIEDFWLPVLSPLVLLFLLFLVIAEFRKKRK